MADREEQKRVTQESLKRIEEQLQEFAPRLAPVQGQAPPKGDDFGDDI